jgi:hypothetical protein
MDFDDDIVFPAMPPAYAADDDDADTDPVLWQFPIGPASDPNCPVMPPAYAFDDDAGDDADTVPVL